MILNSEQIDNYQKDGAIVIKDIFKPWVNILTKGFEKVLKDPGPHARENTSINENGRFFEDYCNWDRITEFEKFAKESGIKIITIADLISYRYSNEKIIEKTSTANLPTKFGDFTAIGYKSLFDSDEHVALVKGNIDKNPTLVRVHSECLSGDFLGSLRCDCGDQASSALESIGKEKSGVFLYMKQEGRGIGLHNKLKAYELQDGGADTVEANEILGFPPDLRHYGVGAQILADIGLKKIKLMTNNPKKVVGLEGYGMEIVDTIPLNVEPNPINEAYLKTKKDKLGHKIENV